MGPEGTPQPLKAILLNSMLTETHLLLPTRVFSVWKTSVFPGLETKFHASCGTFSRQNEAFFDKNCQILVIFQVFRRFSLKPLVNIYQWFQDKKTKNLKNYQNLVVFIQKGFVLLNKSTAGWMNFFFQFKKHLKSYRPKRRGLVRANVFFSVLISKTSFKFCSPYQLF